MWFARYFPGLMLDQERLDQLTLEETRAMRKAGNKLLENEEEGRLAHTKGIMAASSGRRLF